MSPLLRHDARRAGRPRLSRTSRLAAIALVNTAFAAALTFGPSPANAASPTPTIGTSTPSSGASTPGSGAATPGGAAKTPAAPRATFGIGPATLGKSGARPYFSYQMGVGGSLADHVAVFNYGAKPLTLSVFAADLTNSDDGSLAVGLQGAATNDAGSWVRLAAKVQVVTLPAQNKNGPGKALLPLTLSVPKDAIPGDHGAAIVATLSTLGKNPKGEDVKLDQRIATRMYVRVAGPLHPALTIENVKVAYHATANPIGSGAATVTYTVHNTGNVRLSARQAVAVSGMFGTKAKEVAPPDLALLFPRSSETVTVNVADVRPTIWQKARITVTPALFADQAPMAVPTARAVVGFTAVPWTLVAIIAALLLLAAALLARQLLADRPSASSPTSHGHRQIRRHRNDEV
jgi:hypothetical protein